MKALRAAETSETETPNDASQRPQDFEHCGMIRNYLRDVATLAGGIRRCQAALSVKICRGYFMLVRYVPVCWEMKLFMMLYTGYVTHNKL